MSDEAVAMMQSVTGASAETCAQYLTATNGDIDSAVNLLLAAGPDATPSAAPPVEPPRRTSPRAEDDIGFVTPQTASTLADGGGGGHAGMNYAYVQGGSRDTFDPAVFGGVPSGNPVMDLQQQLALAQSSIARLTSGGAMGGAPSSSAWSGGPPPSAGPGGHAPSELDAMFAVPDYAHKGTWARAIKDAAAEGKWVLLSLVEDSFENLCMNRDILRDEMVGQLLQCNYVLWQAKASSRAGQEVMTKYRIGERGIELPILIIIHPITGAELGKITRARLTQKPLVDASKPLDPNRMQDALLHFADSNPAPVVPTAIAVDDEPDAPVAAVQPPAPAGATAVDANEDPELAAALAASEETFASEQKKASAGAASVPEKVDATDDSDSDVVEESGPSAAQPAEEQVKAVDLDEMQVDAAAEGSMRLRVRLQSGPWNLCLPSSFTLADFVAGIRTRLSKDGVDTSNLSLLVGFPPKKIFEPGQKPSDDVTLATVPGLRNGDVVTPHW